MILRCTGKVLSLLYPAAWRLVASVPVDENDWYANLLWIDRRKCLLVTHAGTLFSALAPDVRATEVRPIGRFIVPLIEHELLVEGHVSIHSANLSLMMSWSPRLRIEASLDA